MKPIIYESSNRDTTVYARKSSGTARSLLSVDAVWRREQELSSRWVNLKEAVFMADTDPTLNDALSKLEMLYAIKKQERT